MNRVQPGYIRTEADEVHYNLHVMLRFDLERALVAGELARAIWRRPGTSALRRTSAWRSTSPRNGMLQDVHWSIGLFGYFPTYTLGNVYAGCLHQSLQAAVPERRTSLAQGEARPATDWLRTQLQCHGGLCPPAETVAHACGFAPTEGPLLDYLETKFRAIYRLAR